MAKQVFPYALLILATGCSLPSVAEEPQQAWQQQFSITLPERTRSIRLNPEVDAKQWLLQNNLSNANVMPLGSQGSLVDVPMNDVEWQNAQTNLCQQSDVALCEVTQCRAIQFNGQLRSAQKSSPNAIKARLVRNNPEHVPEQSDGSCRAPVALPLDEIAANEGAAGQQINLDLNDFGIESRQDFDSKRSIESPQQNIGTRVNGEAQNANAETQTTTNEITGADETATKQNSLNAEDAQTGSATGNTAQNEFSQKTTAEQQAEQNPTDIATRAFEWVLDTRLGIDNDLLVDASDLPDDTTEWTLVVGEDCNEVHVPLDSLEPAKRPGRIVALTDPGAAQLVAAAVGATVESEVNLDTTDRSLAVFTTDDNVEQLIAVMLLDPRVSVAQRDFIYRTTADEITPTLPESITASHQVVATDQDILPIDNPVPTYGDTYAALTYGPKFTGALNLHAKVHGEGQIVAVIDTGIDTQHPELIGRIHGEPINTTEYDWSADAHGTAIAGIIAANANNNEGIFGVAPAAEILAIKACQPREQGGMAARCFTSTLVKALDAAMTQNATLINMSLSGPPDDLVEQYVTLALEQGRVVIAAAGNGGPNAKPGFPAAIADVVAVTAVDINSHLYKDANLGDYIDVSAPGVDIISPAPGGSYPVLSGTSMAAAHVTGVAALLKQLAPSLDGPQIARQLTANTLSIGDTHYFGRGLLDACSAAQNVTQETSYCSATVESPAPDSIASDEAEPMLGENNE